MSSLAHSLRRRLAAVLLVLAAIAALGFSACGGDEEDAQQTLDTAFSKPIKSADVSVEVEADLEGVERLENPVRLRLGGPFESAGKDQLPSLDWKLTFTGAGRSLSAGAVSTGDNVFVNYQGESYEVGESAIRQVNQQAARSRGDGQTLDDLGLNPRDWIQDAEVEGDEEVAGVETTHVSAGLDVGKLIEDLNGVIERAPPQLRSQAPPKLTEDQRKKVEEVVGDPSFDVYVGKEDDTLRRLSADLEFEIPEDDRDQAGGLEGGNISFSIEFAEVGQDQRIEAPANARPISQLLSQLGAGALLGGSGAGGSGSPPGSGSGGGGAGSGAGSAQAPDAAKLQRYSRCLRGADAGNIEALQRCAQLLR